MVLESNSHNKNKNKKGWKFFKKREMKKERKDGKKD